MKQQTTAGTTWPHDQTAWPRNLHWLSVFLRASLGTLFLSAAISKLPGGVSGTVRYYSKLFEHSLLPGFLVTAHATVIIGVELTLAAWLLSGYRLALAWKAAATVLISLAVGMIFAGKTDVASDNYVYVALSLGGLLASPFDRWQWGAGALSVLEEDRTVGLRPSQKEPLSQPSQQ